MLLLPPVASFQTVEMVMPQLSVVLQLSDYDPWRNAHTPREPDQIKLVLTQAQELRVVLRRNQNGGRELVGFAFRCRIRDLKPFYENVSTSVE